MYLLYCINSILYYITLSLLFNNLYKLYFIKSVPFPAFLDFYICVVVVNP